MLLRIELFLILIDPPECQQVQPDDNDKKHPNQRQNQPPRRPKLKLLAANRDTLVIASDETEGDWMFGFGCHEMYLCFIMKIHNSVIFYRVHKYSLRRMLGMARRNTIAPAR